MVAIVLAPTVKTKPRPLEEEIMNSSMDGRWVGAQPLDAFVRVIDDEVARSNSTGSKSR